MELSQILYDTTRPYKVLDQQGIEYTVCKDYSHISRYKRLRQVIHYLSNNNRFMSLELQNSYDYSNVEAEYYTVPADRINRLDLISYEYFGSASYSWIIAYINGIGDDYTIFEGQTLLIPKSLTQLFTNESVLASTPITSLNLGTE